MKKVKKALLIINPISGTRSKSEITMLFQSEMERKGYDVIVKETQGAGDATQFARLAVEEHFSLVVTAGGDGTVNEAAKALLNTDVVFGIIPCGSGNGFARTLGLPSDFKDAIRVIGENYVINCDCGVVNGIPFFCTCGLGFDAEVSERFASEKRRGRLSYIKDALIDYINYSPKSYAISTGGKILTEKAFLIAVCNASQYGNNAYIAPKALLTDGMLDVTIVHSGSILDTALAGIDLFTGYLDKNTLIQTIRTNRLRIARLDNGCCHVDGDPMEMGKVLEIDCHPGVLKVISRAGMENFRPIVTPFKSMVEDVISDLKNLVKF